LPSGTKHAEQKPRTPDLPEAWEVDIRALIASLSSNH
jgi:hypothetical protein